MAKINLKAALKWITIACAGFVTVATKIEEDKRDAQHKEMWKAYKNKTENK